MALVVGGGIEGNRVDRHEVHKMGGGHEDNDGRQGNNDGQQQQPTNNYQIVSQRGIKMVAAMALRMGLAGCDG